MCKVTAKEIREQLRQYLAGALDRTAFRDWFAVTLRDVHASSDPSAEQLAHAVEWAFCDLECGAAVEQVRGNLTALSEHPESVVLIQCSQPMEIPSGLFHGTVSTGTSSIPEVPASVVGALVGVGRAVEYAS